MANTILMKHSSSGTPLSADVEEGELLIHTHATHADGRKLYFGDSLDALRTFKISGFDNDSSYLTSINNSNWSGTDLSVANGGTGASTLTSNYVLLGNGTSSPQMIAPGNDGNVLTSTGSTWQSEAPAGGGGSGTVTSIAMGAGMGGSTITSTGTIAVDGNLQDLDTLGPVSSNSQMIVGTSSGVFAYESGATLRTSIGCDAAGTDNSTNVSLTNVEYLSLDGQAITPGTVPVGSGGTGTTSLTDGGVLIGNGTGAIVAMGVLANSAMIVGDGSADPVAESGSTLRTSIGCDAAGTDNSTNVTLASVSSNYLSLSGQAITAGNVPVSLGGTGLTSLSTLLNSNVTSVSGNAGTVTTNANLTGPVTSSGNATTIASSAVTTAKINADAVTNAKIADDAVDTENIADDAITAALIDDGAVVAAGLGSSAVTTAKINADAVTNAKIADDAVDTENIADDAITAALIDDGAVVAAGLGSSAVTTAKINATAVTQAKIAGEAIDESRLHVSNGGTNGYSLTFQSGNTGKLTWADISGGGGGGGIAIASGDTNNYVMTSDGTGDSILGESEMQYSSPTLTLNNASAALRLDGARAGIVIGSAGSSNINTGISVYEHGGTSLKTGSNTDQLVVIAVNFMADPFTGYVIDVSATTVTMNHAGGIYYGST